MVVIQGNCSNAYVISSDHDSSISALCVRVINQLIRGGRVQYIITSRRTTRDRPRLLTTTWFPTKLIPFKDKGRMAIRSSLCFVFQRVTIIRDMGLFGSAIPIISSEVLLVRVGVEGVYPYRYSYL